MVTGRQAGEGSPVLLLTGVVRRFGDVTALAGIDLELRSGEVVGLLGHNGAGKTTTVRVIAGLLPPDAGTVRVMGRDPGTDGAEVRRTLGVLPARAVVDGRLTARQNLRFAGDVFGVSEDVLEDRIDEMLALFELEDRADERVAGFSTGMRQRLSLARVLLPDPPVLLLDEPTAALDPVAARSVRRLLADLADDRERTVLICTHDLPEAEQLCDRVVVLEHGRVVADASPRELAAEHDTATVRIELDADDLERAAGLIGEQLPDVSTEDVGGRLHLHPLPREAVPELLAVLQRAGIAVYELRRLEPTLEEVYLAIHARPGRGGSS